MKKIKFGNGVKVKKLRFRVIVPTDSNEKIERLEKRLLGKAKDWKMYGEDTGFSFIDSERDVDIDVKKGTRISTGEEIQIRKASEELYGNFERSHEQPTNQFFLFDCEDSEGNEFSMNLGTTKSNTKDYIQEDNLIELEQLQVRVNNERVSEYG